MVQAPTPVTLTVAGLTLEPEIAQVPLGEAEKLTGRPESAMAFTVKIAGTILLESGPKVIDWLALLVAIVCGPVRGVLVVGVASLLDRDRAGARATGDQELARISAGAQLTGGAGNLVGTCSRAAAARVAQGQLVAVLTSGRSRVAQRRLCGLLDDDAIRDGERDARGVSSARARAIVVVVRLEVRIIRSECARCGDRKQFAVRNGGNGVVGVIRVVYTIKRARFRRANAPAGGFAPCVCAGATSLDGAVRSD